MRIDTTNHRTIVGRVAQGGAALLIAGGALLGGSGIAVAAEPTSTVVTGNGTVSYNGETLNFAVNVENRDGTTTGSCSFTGPTTNVQCTSVYDFQRNSTNKVTTRGTATLNGRPISFTAVLTDAGDGGRDSYTLYAAGRVIGGQVIKGDVAISD